ncbi:MAG: sulfatase-like hydrolase/transferase [Myxococcota bacterium]|nr:sulfatase-like hydrolase/transferase [Myxococcota bacterium]
MADRTPPTPGARNLVLITFDSCRHDTFVAAAPRAIARLGAVERRFSYASWTAPSHYNLLMGLMPHPSPTHVFASEHYKRDFLRFSERLGIEGVAFEQMLPALYLPPFLRDTHGYHTRALVSLPVMNEHTPLAVGFDSYELMPTHNDMEAMLGRLRFDPDRPTFTLLNVGETHYPYALPDEPSEEWPRIAGVNGVFRSLGEGPAEGHLHHRDSEPRFFDDARLERLRRRQIRAVAHLDGVVERLFDVVPPGTWIVITSDHGELFGEDGYFGHGPIMHPKVFEVPFVEGLRP